MSQNSTMHFGILSTDVSQMFVGGHVLKEILNVCLCVCGGEEKNLYLKPWPFYACHDTPVSWPDWNESLHVLSEEKICSFKEKSSVSLILTC